MITVLAIIITLLTVLVIVLGFVIRNLLTQNDTLNENLEVYSNAIETVENEAIKYQKYFLQLFTQTYQELQRIDKKGSFSSDDEVGFAFRVILTSIESLKDKIGSVEIEQEVSTEKGKR
jgi:type II secretory pathway pseudopilin PulG